MGVIIRSEVREHRQASDPGMSLVEVLVAITLIGTVVVAVLTAVGATVKATAIERDHAKAQQWLQASIGVIEAVDFASCDPSVTTGANVQQAYQTAVNAGAQRPWEYDGTLAVGVPEVWDGTTFVPFSTQVSGGAISVCYDQARLRQQRVRLVVSHPSGINESVEMIKVDR